MDIGFYRYSLLNRGGDRLIVEYANHLVVSGHTVTMHVKQLNTMFTIHPNVHIQKVPWPGKAGFLFYGTLRRFCHDIMLVDIIHLPLLLSIRNRVIYYAQADDMEYYDNALLRKAIDMLYTIYFRAGKPIISMSQHLTEIFIKRYAFHNTHTIKTGIDHATFYPEPDEELIRSKRSNRAIVFMARGDAYRKGHDSALKVFEALDKDAVTGLELWVCGDFFDENRYSFPVRNFGIVTDTRLRQLLSSADIFFYPSRHEGFGLFPLEAMACGCAVVTTTAIPYARGSHAILCSHPEDVADLTRNLSRLIYDTTFLEQRKQDGIQEAGRYDLEKSKAAFESALSEILAGK